MLITELKNKVIDNILCFRDEKQIDLAEQLESVAFVLCGEDHISLDKFCQIFQAKGVSLFTPVLLLNVKRGLNLDSIQSIHV